MKIIELIFADLPYLILSSIFETIVFIIKSPFGLFETASKLKEPAGKNSKEDPFLIKMVNFIVGGFLIDRIAWFFSKVLKINL